MFWWVHYLSWLLYTQLINLAETFCNVTICSSGTKGLANSFIQHSFQRASSHENLEGISMAKLLTKTHRNVYKVTEWLCNARLNHVVRSEKRKNFSNACFVIDGGLLWNVVLESTNAHSQMRLEAFILPEGLLIFCLHASHEASLGCFLNHKVNMKI